MRYFATREEIFVELVILGSHALRTELAVRFAAVGPDAGPERLDIEAAHPVGGRGIRWSP